MLRALRILRALRLITAVPALKAVVAGLLAALPGMGSIVVLIGLLYYVFAVIAIKLYGTEFPELFGTLGRSLFTLFTVMTLEGWVEVVKSMMEKFPYAWVFFVTFIVTTTFMVLNLFIGVVVNAMQAEARQGIRSRSSRPSARSSRRRRRRSCARSRACGPRWRSCGKVTGKR